jgi:hypothetical protein
MESYKCLSCGLVNPATEPNCRRCKTAHGSAPSLAPSQQPSQPTGPIPGQYPSQYQQLPQQWPTGQPMPRQSPYPGQYPSAQHQQYYPLPVPSQTAPSQQPKYQHNTPGTKGAKMGLLLGIVAGIFCVICFSAYYLSFMRPLPPQPIIRVVPAPSAQLTIENRQTKVDGLDYFIVGRLTRSSVQVISMDKMILGDSFSNRYYFTAKNRLDKVEIKFNSTELAKLQTALIDAIAKPAGMEETITVTSSDDINRFIRVTVNRPTLPDWIEVSFHTSIQHAGFALTKEEAKQLAELLRAGA